MLPINNKIKKIETNTKTVLWSMVKLINSSKEEMMAAKTLVRYAPQLLKGSAETKEARGALLNTYKGTIHRAIFAQRNYVAVEHKRQC